MDFVHLHVQSAYSLLNSTVKIDELVSKVKNSGMHSIALADRNVMYGAIPFYKECKKNKIKPIIGLLADVLHGEEAYPLLLLARNNQGYSNLLKISSSIQIMSKNGIPLKWLKGYRDGLIAITPGDEGIIESLVKQGEIDRALNELQNLKSIFGRDSFHIAIQRSENQVTPLFHKQLLDLAKSSETAIVATNPIKYLHADDQLAYEVLRAVDGGIKLTAEAKRNEQDAKWYFKDTKEMQELFYDIPEALQNSVDIAKLCSVEIKMNQSLLPKYPSDIPADELLEKVCYEGFIKRYPNAPNHYKERLQYELSVIKKMNFSDYFLIVWDFMKYARKINVLTGPGRGSAAGSMVAYVLQITNIDPMEHHLLFERFLNPERISMPDIDIDFSDTRRDEVIKYVAEKYGDVHVAQIITFGTFAAKASLRDTGRAFGLNSTELDQLSKMVPNRLGITLLDALKESIRLQQFYEENTSNRNLIQTAMKIEGLPRHTSTHAAGVVICDRPLTDTIAIQEGHNDVHLTQFPMETLEELGLLKMDFLGLRNLTLMERVLFSIRKTTGKSLDINSIPMDDEKTFKMLGKGETIGIFQFESDGMQNVLKQLKPERFEDLVAVNALYRPGPMDNIPSYINRRHGKEPVSYVHHDLKDILENTYGIIVYQEQIMQIASKFAGFSLGQADLLRRAVSKKKADVLEEQRKYFVRGSLKQGYKQETAELIYDYIVKFANYGFNLSHAAAYSLIAYQLGYLKAHYPKLFMAALMSSVIGNDSKMTQYVRELKKLRIPLLPPSINKSTYAFRAESDGIRYSIGAIKGVGGTAVKDIMQARQDKKFNDLFDFCVRVPSKSVNRKTIEALIYAGAFDEWGQDRATLLASIDVAINHAELASADGLSFDLFQSSEFNLQPKYTVVEPITLEYKLLYEKEVLGFYLSDHPTKTYQSLFQHFATTSLYTIVEGKESKYAIGVYVTEAKSIRTKKGEVMSFLTLSDDSDEIEAVAFPDVYKKHSVQLSKGNLLMLQGYTELRNGKKQYIIQDVFSIEQLIELKKQTSTTIYIKIGKQHQSYKELWMLMRNQLKKYPGATRVMLYLEKENRTILLPMWEWVNASEPLIEHLSKLVGRENIIIKNH